VPLADALSAQATSVVDFAGVGCQTFALSTGGLYRLDAAAGSAVGTWQRVALSSDDAGVSWATGRLYSDGQALAVFHEHGVAERVDVPPCP
jgi:hypothetical protein